MQQCVSLLEELHSALCGRVLSVWSQHSHHLVEGTYISLWDYPQGSDCSFNSGILISAKESTLFFTISHSLPLTPCKVLFLFPFHVTGHKEGKRAKSMDSYCFEYLSNHLLLMITNYLGCVLLIHLSFIGCLSCVLGH